MQPQSGRPDEDSWDHNGEWTFVPPRATAFANRMATPPQRPEKRPQQFGLKANRQNKAGGPLPQSEQQLPVYRTLPEPPIRHYGRPIDSRQANQLGKFVSSTSQIKTQQPQQKQPARVSIKPGQTLVDIKDRLTEVRQSPAQTESSRPMSASAVDVRKRKARPRPSAIIDILSDSESQPSKRTHNASTSLIAETIGRPLAVAEVSPRASSPSRKQYRGKGALVNDELFKGSTMIVFDSRNKTFALRLPKGKERVPGAMEAHEPVVVPLAELEKLVLCDGGEGVGKFLVLQATRDIDDVRKLGVESSAKDRFVVFVKDEDFPRLTEDLKRSGQASSLLASAEPFKSGEPTCARYLNGFPPLQFNEESRPSPTRTPTRRSARQSRRTLQDVEILDDSDWEDNARPSRSRAPDDEEEKLYLRYPVNESAQDVISIVNGDLNRLNPEEYLNDNLIDFAIRHMVAENPDLSEKVHVFSCLFYSKMLEATRLRGSGERDQEAYRLVAKWSRGVDIFSKNFIFVPINENMHWSLSVIVRPGASPDGPGNRPCILYLDSMRLHNTNKIHRFLVNYLKHEWNSQGRPEREFSKQTIPAVKVKVPQQQNAYDCGVYTIMYAEMIFHNMMPSHEEDIKDRFNQYFAHHKITQQEVDEKRTKIRSLLDIVKTDWDAEQQLQAQIRQIKAQEEQEQQQQQQHQQQQQQQSSSSSQNPDDDDQTQLPSDTMPSDHQQPPMDIAGADDEASTRSISAESES